MFYEVLVGLLCNQQTPLQYSAFVNTGWEVEIGLFQGLVHGICRGICLNWFTPQIFV